MTGYSHFDYYLRSVTTAVLALVVLGVTAWQVIAGSGVNGPFGNWAGLILGVYFGAHVSLNGSGARRRADAAEITTPVVVTPSVTVTPTPTPTPPHPPAE